MNIKTLADIEHLEKRGFDEVFPHQSPWDILRHNAAHRPESVAIRYLRDVSAPDQDQIITHAQLAQQAMGAARLFRRAGVSADRSVALLTQHTPSGQAALWGAQIAGRACPINPMLSPEHIASLIHASNSAAVVAMGVNDDLDIWTPLIPALRAQGVELPIFACDSDRDSPGSDGEFETLIAQPGQDIIPTGDSDQIAAYYHTGGTTGAPKLVCHTRLSEAHVARSCALMHDLGPDDVMVNGFPLFHVAGAFVYGLSTLSAGGSLVIPGRLGMRNGAFISGIWQQVERLGITVIGAVPTVLAALKGVPIDADITSLRHLLTGGSPLPTELAEAVEAHTGKPVRNILGMTESAGAIAVEPVHAPRTPLSCGLRLPFTELAIFDNASDHATPDTLCPAGQTGIMATRGPNVAVGYSDPTRNAGTFLPGGWLISGDLGQMDTQGRLFISGREKDIIIRGAHNIDPQMIEDALLAHPKIETAAAVGMPDAYAGELPVAFVTTRDGWHPDPAELDTFVRDRITDPVARPKRIQRIETMPLTPIGKIFKPDLRARATVWAIQDAAREDGIEVRVQINEGLEVEVHAPADQLKKLKTRLTGMPVSLTLCPV